IRAAAGNHAALAMPKDEHRSFARDARDFAKDELVGDHIAEHCDRDAGQGLDDLDQALAFSGKLAHSVEFSHAEGLRSRMTLSMVSRASAASSNSMRTRAMATLPSFSICTPRLIPSFSVVMKPIAAF